MKLKLWFLLLGVGWALTPLAWAQAVINWSTLDGGGGTATGGVYSVSATIGQPDAGGASGGGYTVAGGFWSVLGVIETPGAPELRITHPGTEIVVSWPLPVTDWVLDRTCAWRIVNPWRFPGTPAGLAVGLPDC